jgi:hypothetical protein
MPAMAAILRTMSEPYGQQPLPGGQLVLTLRKPLGLLAASMISPVVTIDGYPAPAHWEQNLYPVVAGQHHLQVSSSYLWRYGTADLPIMMYPGRSVEVHYSGPVVTFLRGSIGFEPQPRPGMPVFWAIIALPIVLVALVLILALTTS